MKKIMFNDEFMLTKAVLDGRKTQTRRLLTLTLHKETDEGNNLIEVHPSKVFFMMVMFSFCQKRIIQSTMSAKWLRWRKVMRIAETSLIVNMMRMVIR